MGAASRLMTFDRCYITKTIEIHDVDHPSNVEILTGQLDGFQKQFNFACVATHLELPSHAI